jgi:uncharacterized delta-60 repeat protein
LLLLAGSLDRTLGAPGDLDLSFDPGSTVNGSVNAVALLNDGKVLIGGNFTAVHGAMRSSLARLNADGSTDLSFLLGLGLIGNSASTPTVNCLAVQKDGKILMGGSFISTNGMSHTNIARLNPNGSVDDTFLTQLQGPNVYALWGGSVDSIIPQSDGKLLLSGGFTSVNGVPRSSLARINSEGTLDLTFNAILGTGFAQPWLNAVALQSDGRILIAGNFNQVNSVTRNYFARLNADGSLDTSCLSEMGANDGGSIESIACLPGGKILIGGVFSSIAGAVHTGIARLNGDGSLDASFVASAGWVYSLFVQPDGKLLVGGVFSQVNGAAQDGIARLSPDGSLDSSVPNGVAGSGGRVNSIVLQGDGKIVFGGGFAAATGNDVARLNADGSPDNTFCNGPSGPNKYIYALAVQPDQKILISGVFDAVSGVGPMNIARLNTNGSVDLSFAANVEGMVLSPTPVGSLLVQSDGKILIGGSFTLVNGLERARIARLNSNGSLDDSFLHGLAGADDQVLCIALQSDGKILIGGYFTSINGVTRKGLARLNPDGSLDAGFLNGLTGPNDVVVGLAVQPDGQILVGGYFTLVNGVTRNRVARLNADGSLDNSFQNGLAGANGTVGGFAVLPDGRILIGGGFTSINGAATTNVARLYANGLLDSSFVCASLPGSVSQDALTSFALRPGGQIVMARSDEWSRNCSKLVCLLADGSLDTSFFGGQPGPDRGVGCLGLQPGGKIVIGGFFTRVNQTPCSYVARLTGDSEPPAIIVPPKSQTAEAGSTINFWVQASGSMPLSYVWYFNGTNFLASSTNCHLGLSNLQFARAGAYTVVVTNFRGAATSSPAMLNVITPVERRPVPALSVRSQAGSLLEVDYADSVSPTHNWTTLGYVSVAVTPQYYFDLTLPLPPQRFYRTSLTGGPFMPLVIMGLHIVPAITLTGDIGNHVRVDCINRFGPIDAWIMLDTVTLTNTSQLYFDTSAPGQPERLYRLVQTP